MPFPFFGRKKEGDPKPTCKSLYELNKMFTSKVFLNNGKIDNKYALKIILLGLLAIDLSKEESGYDQSPLSGLTDPNTDEIQNLKRNLNAFFNRKQLPQYTGDDTTKSFDAFLNENFITNPEFQSQLGGAKKTKKRQQDKDKNNNKNNKKSRKSLRKHKSRS